MAEVKKQEENGTNMEIDNMEFQMTYAMSIDEWTSICSEAT